jgi:myo-inositol 2-dehydrogenase/D-chiro-inositol 1-dehydrogenase
MLIGSFNCPNRQAVGAGRFPPKSRNWGGELMSIGVGVIGAGVMGLDHVRTLTNQVARVRVVAIYDQDLRRAQTAAAEACGARAMADPHALIADKEVEAVVVVSPDETHTEYTLACLAAAKPVLCEKPLAPNTQECHRIVEAEQSVGRSLVQVGYMRRFDPAYVEIKRRLATRELGDALLLHCVHRNAVAPPWFTAMMSITNALVHEFDIIRWLLGKEIANIQILHGKMTRHSQAPDPLFAIMRMDDDQLVDAEVFMNSNYGYDVRTEVVCEKGTITMSPPVHAEVREGGSQSFPFARDWRPRFADAYRRQMQAWIDSLEAKSPVGASAWDGYVATAVAEAGVRALRCGASEKVELPDLPTLYARG